MTNFQTNCFVIKVKKKKKKLFTYIHDDLSESYHNFDNKLLLNSKLKVLYSNILKEHTHFAINLW